MPDYKGDDLNADMDAVWETAARNFPAMARAYHEANGAVYRTSEVIYPDGQTQFMTPWRKIRDQLISILGQSSRNVEDTGTALREAMTAYAEQDEDAAAALRLASEDMPGDVPELPPTKIPPSIASQIPYNTQPYHPVGTEQLQRMYAGDAPTAEELLEKAQQVDDKLYEADLAARGLVGDLLGLVPRSWVEGTARDSGMYLFIVDLMNESVFGNPANYAQGAVALEEIADLDSDGKPFGMFRTEVENAKDALHPETWGGDAAREFRANFLNAYEDIAAAQAVVVGLLQSSLDGYTRALEETYRQYMSAMESTIKACQGIIDGAAKAESGFVTTLLSAALTVGGIIATGGTSALAQTASLFSLAGSGLSIASSEYVTGGGDVGTIHENLVNAVRTIKGKLEDFDEQLARGLNEDVGVIDDLRTQDRRIVLPRPNFADDPALF